ncbi:MAG TPA: YfhO family protein [Thermoanaerobaculia bacterium]
MTALAPSDFRGLHRAKIRPRKRLKIETVALWLTYAASAAVVLWLARRLVGEIPGRAAAVLALLPLVFTGKAMLLGRLYGPSDLYFTANPWRSLPSAAAVGPPRNSILSDLAFANLPWRAAVREAVANGRAPLWNRFVLAGTPLLPAAQAGVFHPSTFLSLFMPLALSWTFSCTFTLFLALVCAYLFFRELTLGVLPALLGAAAWAFSTYVVFWVGWSVGPSTASLPLLLVGLRRLAREPGRAAILLTAVALALSVFGGHPESAFHGAAAGGVFFLWELFGREARRRRALGGALAAGGLAILLSGPQLFPLLEAIPHSAEYRARHASPADDARPAARQSVALSAALPRLLPDALPFAHGIYGRSPVQDERGDGSGMPLGYAGALLFPLAGLAFRGHRRRERWIFLALFVAGLLFGASVPGLIDVTSRLPGFALALNYRLVFLSGLGLAGLAAIGAERLLDRGAARSLAWSCAGWTLAICVAFALSRGVFRERGLSSEFVFGGLALEVGPLLLLAALAGAGALRGVPLAACALGALVLQRGLEMGGTYPTLPASTLAPALPALASVPLSSEPCRVVAAGDTLRPNGAALYRLEDVRGYESLVLDRFTDTYPLWSRSQAASFNLVPDLSRPFLSFLNACYAMAAPGDPVPAGWREQARGAEMAIFDNPEALPRAFVPRRLRRVADPRERLREMAAASDFSRTAWLSDPGERREPETRERRGSETREPGERREPEEPNGEATLFLRSVGPDLIVEARAAAPALIATSIPDWPGWTATENGAALPTLTVNHAFVGVRVPAGEHVVRFAYRPRSWTLGLVAFAAGFLLIVAVAAVAPVARRGRAGLRRESECS